MSGPPPPLGTAPGAVAPFEALVVVAICFGWFIALSIDAMAAGFPAAGAFTDGSLVSLILVEAVLAAAALLFLQRRGHSLPALLPTPSWRGGGSGVLLCILAWLAWQIVGQVFSASDFDAQPIADMTALSRPSFAIVLLVSWVNGLYEETFLVGYLLRGMASLGASTAIGVSVLVRLLYHLYQGPIGAVSVVVFGVVMGLWYWRTRTLWPIVVAHALTDALALA